ncbi:uncharacterized protein LOC108739638 [Agrilus planipennis]|uniref:Uncharacterized protein LOC108739638 n=1 Tax=Agrilus planipennis TaxID=224129 RepID=A0A7F5R2C3_AGRPL|nr:uncharacterized protein LOC108739638 [Agrilus planipennis]
MLNKMNSLNLLSSAAVITFVIFTSIIETSEAIKCYKCTILPPPIYSNETSRLCAFFDYTDKYIVDCPYSTFCIKRIFTVYLSDAINGTLRGCAPQRNDYQVYKNNKWQMQVNVEEPYEEGCTNVDDKGQRISKPTHCYCRGDLCNGNASFTNINFALNSILTVIICLLSL